MKHLAFTFMFLLLASLTWAACTDPLTLYTWNIRDFGQSRDAGEIAEIADFVKEADILAIQEVVPSTGPDAVRRLVQELSDHGHSREFVVSPPTTGSKSSRERYAYIWNPRKTFLERSFLDSSLESSIDREPYIGVFRIPGRKLTIFSFHAVPTKRKPAQEIRQLIDSTFLLTRPPNALLAVVGDFNLSFRSSAFDRLRVHGLQSHLRGKTALKRKWKNGQHLTKAYDNIFFSNHGTVCQSGILDFSVNYPTLKKARLRMSDHLAGFIKISRS